MSCCAGNHKPIQNKYARVPRGTKRYREFHINSVTYHWDGRRFAAVTVGKECAVAHHEERWRLKMGVLAAYACRDNTMARAVMVLNTMINVGLVTTYDICNTTIPYTVYAHSWSVRTPPERRKLLRVRDAFLVLTNSNLPDVQRHFLSTNRSCGTALWYFWFRLCWAESRSTPAV